MDSVERILNFIDETEQPEPTTEQPEPMTEPTTEPMTEQPEPMTEPQYKRIIRKINNNIKRNKYPCVIETEEQNIIFQSSDELKQHLNKIKEDHRQRLKDERQKNINNYITKNKDSLRKTNKKNYKLNDDEFLTHEGDEERIYRKGPLKAIQHEDDIIEIPNTSKKDRKKIYETVKQDKEALKELINSKTDEEFNIKTYETLKKFDENASKIYMLHHENPFNKDRTWTRNNFIQFLDGMINKEEELRQEAHKRVIRENQQKQTIQENSPYNSYIINQGINPHLMKRY